VATTWSDWRPRQPAAAVVEIINVVTHNIALLMCPVNNIPDLDWL
jgi:hypothetical protein